MRETRIPLINGDEHDVLTGWRKVLSFRSRERRYSKNGYRRRIRRKAREEAREVRGE